MADKEEYIKRFKDTYFKKTGEHLSDAQAMEVFENLIALIEVLL